MIHTAQLPTLTGARVSLRWMDTPDLPAIYQIFSNPEVTRYWSWPAFTNTQQAQELLGKIHQHFAQKDLFQWGIARNSDNQIIGTCTLAHIDGDNRRAELGYILNRAHWGQGYVAEALALLLDFAFGPLNLRRLEADTDPRNLASIKTLLRLGFQQEGLLRERWEVAGEIQDALYFGLLAREWALRNSK